MCKYIEDSDNEKGYYPVEIVSSILDEIEDKINDIILKLSVIEGLDLIEKVKDDLEKLSDDLY